MNPIQILLVLFFVFAAWRAVARGRRGDTAMYKVVLWLVVWAGAIAIVLQPNVTEVFAHVLGVTRGVDLPIYASVTLLFYLVFRLFAKIEDVERQLTKMVRAQAMGELEQRLASAPALGPADVPKA
jgi:hypothetical protein